MRFHTDNGPPRWGPSGRKNLPDAFADGGRGRGNWVVILTDTGDERSGVRAGQSGGSMNVKARGGVVPARGGFENNQ